LEGVYDSNAGRQNRLEREHPYLQRNTRACKSRQRISFLYEKRTELRTMDAPGMLAHEFKFSEWFGLQFALLAVDLADTEAANTSDEASLIAVTRCA